MKTHLECLECIVRQALEGARHATEDEGLHEEVLRRATRALSQMDLHEPSPVMIGAIHRIIREVTDTEDPYAEAKATCNRKALEMYPQLRSLVHRSPRPHDAAVRLAIAGNLFDFVVDSRADESDMVTSVEEELSAELPQQTLAAFQHAVRQAREILYLGDNAGEIVLDRLLIEQLPVEKVTYVVKGNPVVNDVTYGDASMAGIDDMVPVIDNGADLPGTILHACSESFRQRFLNADLIISKGQGNYESLNEIDKDIFFLFKAKCGVMTEHLGCEIGTSIVLRSAVRSTRP